MAQTLQAFDSGHTDAVHDAQLDYYGRRLATCSSDRAIKLFDVSNGAHTHITDLLGHAGPVWQVAWAHPKHGNVLASCSFDHTVIIWQEGSDGGWQRVYQSPPSLHSASVNGVAWAPVELGLILACASSDGSLSVVEYTGGQWRSSSIPNAHAVGATAVGWGPAELPATKTQPETAARRLVSAGCDATLKVWAELPGQPGAWSPAATLTGHTDWVRDAAWSHAPGLPYSTLASAGQDGKVFVWTQKAGAAGTGDWERHLVRDFGVPVWRVSWSLTGNVLAVSYDQDQCALFKETLDGNWEQVYQ